MTFPPRNDCATLFDLPVGRWTTRELIETLCRRARERRPLFVTYLNAHNINVYHRDRAYADALRHADILYADGMSLVWASRWIAPPGLPERVNAGDFLVRFCRTCARRDLSVFLLGSEPGVAARCAERLAARAKGLRVVGTADGFWRGGADSPDERRVVEAVRAAKPDLLLVGMGVPRQELWARRRAADLGVPVIWCVGALFEYFAGRRARAPRWMRRAGLEWAFRLALEPRRLARRYLWGNAEFLWRVARHPRRPSSAAREE